MPHAPGRPVSVLALLGTAIASGAVAGGLAACFIWLVDEGTDLVWTELPDQLGIAPFDSWWLFAVPVVGGALVGLGQRYLGNYPIPIEQAVATWRSGGHIDPATVPRTVVNAVIALVAGGPVGFEAALTGLIGGTATWIGGRLHAVDRIVRQAWGATRVDSLPRAVRALPYWLAALSGLLTFKWFPFGGIDLGFRFGDYGGDFGAVDAVAVFALGAAVAAPTAWAVSVVSRAEAATPFRRAPVLAGMLGGLLFACLAAVNEDVLFSGQPNIQQLPGTGTGDLLYLTVAKWLALVIALSAGWRGGPVFPMFFAVAALGVAVDELVGIGPDLLMVAGIASVSAVFARGRVALAFVLSLYVAPLSYALVVLVGSSGAALALVVARTAGALPARAEERGGGAASS